MSVATSHNPLASEFRKRRTAGKPAGKSRLSSQAPFESAQRVIKRSIPGLKNKVTEDAYVSIGNVVEEALGAVARHSRDLFDANPNTVLTPSIALSAIGSTIDEAGPRESALAHVNAALDKFHAQ